jgi:hypothetical protein
MSGLQASTAEQLIKRTFCSAAKRTFLWQRRLEALKDLRKSSGVDRGSAQRRRVPRCCPAPFVSWDK